MKFKLLLDVLMLCLLLPVTVYQVFWGDTHEWLGAAMLILFILHTAINIHWYKHIFAGEYTFRRIVGTILNMGVLISMLCLAYSGIVLSQYVFAFLPIEGSVALARPMHLAASYWWFVLSCMHLGFHWEMLMNIAKRNINIHLDDVILNIASKATVAGLSVYGIYAFMSERLLDNMFLLTDFAFMDFEQSAFLVLSEYFAMLVLFAAIVHYGLKLAKGLGIAFDGARLLGLFAKKTKGEFHA